jgi:hypothetical protein
MKLRTVEAFYEQIFLPNLERDMVPIYLLKIT